MNWRNIVIAGDVGTGTTTLAKGLAEKLGWKFTSAGEHFRQYSLDHNLPLWNKEAVPDDFELEVDNSLVKKVKNESSFVIEGHYTGWFAREVEDVFRVLLTCDRKVAMERMLSRQHTHKETKEDVEKRREGLYAKFKKLYSQDNYEDPNLYHLVIDTTHTTPQETLQQVLDKIS